MTELEKCIYDFLVQDAGVHNRVCAKARAAKILKIARKQIADKIDVEKMVENYEKKNLYTVRSCYRNGIMDTLEIIKKGE